MIDLTYAMFREINIYLAGLAFLALGYRSVRAWPAEWAKPHHVGHYRSVLVLLVATYVVFSLGSLQHEMNRTQAGPASPAVTLVTIAALAICWHWPHPRPFRREDTDA